MTKNWKTFNIDWNTYWNVIKNQIYTDGEKLSCLIDFLFISGCFIENKNKKD